jgi:hypothetical protein
LIEGSSIDRRGGVFIALLKETGCTGAKLNQPESVRGLGTNPQKKIHGPIRVLEFGVLGFKVVLVLTGAAFLGAAGTRRRVVRVVFGEPALLTWVIDVFFKAFGLDSFRIGLDSAPPPANNSLINLQASSACWAIKTFCSGSARRCA